MTTAPLLSMSALMNRGDPIAAMRISARLVCAASSCVPLWTSVTVAFALGPFCIRRAASGFPTMLLRPTITTSRPLGSYPLRVRSSTTPEGVAGANRGRPISTRPTFTGWKQSTSLSGLTAETALSTEIWSGNGCWTRIPWTFGSLFNRPISWRRRPSGTSPGSSIVQWAMPISSEAFPFIFTQSAVAEFPPTRTAASPGTTPSPASFEIRGFSSVRTSSAIRLPSMTLPGTWTPEGGIGSVDIALSAKHAARVRRGEGCRSIVRRCRQTKTLRRPCTKTLKSGRDVRRRDALYRLVSPPHGTSARGPDDCRGEQGVPQSGLEDPRTGGPDGHRSRGRREAPARNREDRAPERRRLALRAGQARVPAAGARAPAVPEADTRGPGSEHRHDPSLPAPPPGCERDRSCRGARFLRIHDSQQPAGPDGRAADHQAARPSPPTRRASICVPPDGPWRRPRGAVPGRGDRVRPK